MKNKYLFVFLLLLALSLAGIGVIRFSISGERQKEEEFVIVTSFYPMQIAAMNVAADCPGVTVKVLSGPETGCLHDYQLTPQDMILLSGADVFIVNGGGIEGFLAEAAEEYPRLVIINAGEAVFEEDAGENAKDDSHAGEVSENEKVFGEGQEEGHYHGENAHAWMSIRHYRQQVEAICRGLSEADPAHALRYEQNRDRYLEEICQVEEQADKVRALTEGQPVVILHEAYEYLAEDLGMTVEGLLNLDEERQVSAGELAGILTTIRRQQIRVLLAEEQYGQELQGTLEQETDGKVYYLDTLVRGEVRPEAWIQGMQENLRILAEAFR